MRHVRALTALVLVLVAFGSGGAPGLPAAAAATATATGNDVASATKHRVDAIAAVPTRVLERYATPAMRDARGIARNWYLGQPGCTAADKAAAGGAVACDEFPNWSMEAGGRPGAVSLRYIPFADNSLEGVRLGQFFVTCSDVSGADREPFLVVPIPALPATLYHCGS
jgi:hypothetical protein